jgi:tetratricopeptide (TPR) repeat protein
MILIKKLSYRLLGLGLLWQSHGMEIDETPFSNKQVADSNAYLKSWTLSEGYDIEIDEPTFANKRLADSEVDARSPKKKRIEDFEFDCLDRKIEENLELLDQISAPKLIGWVQNELGELYYLKNNIPYCIVWFEKAEAQLYPTNNDYLGNAYYQMGKYHQGFSKILPDHTESAITYLTKAIKKGHPEAGEAIKTVGNENYFGQLPEDVQKLIVQHYLVELQTSRIRPENCIAFMFTCHQAYRMGQREDKILPKEYRFFNSWGPYIAYLRNRILIMFPALTRLILTSSHSLTHLFQLTNLTRLKINNHWTITDDTLSRLTKLIHLTLKDCDKITDIGISPLTNLTSLKIVFTYEDEKECCSEITDAGLSRLTNLTNLGVPRSQGRMRITDDGLSRLTNLTKLNLDDNFTITDVGILRFKKLISLNLFCNNVITDVAVSQLTNLTRLNLGANHIITDDAVSLLTNLTRLDLENNDTLTNVGISRLMKLTWLRVHENNAITDDAVSRLTNLTHLEIDHMRSITDFGVSPLMNLIHLRLENINVITDIAISQLTTLTHLDLCEVDRVTDGSVSRLTNLRSLNFTFTRGITDIAISRLPNLTRLNRQPYNQRDLRQG